MSYTDINITRAEQSDAGNGTDLIGGRTIDGKAWQGVVSPDALGTWGNTSGGLVEAHSAVAAATVVYDVSCCLDDSAAADYWFCVVNKATAPANSDVVVSAVKVSAGSTSGIAWRDGRPLTLGLALCISTTLDTVTLPTDLKAKFEWNAD